MNDFIKMKMFHHDIRVIWYDPSLDRIFLTLTNVKIKYKGCYFLGFL